MTRWTAADISKIGKAKNGEAMPIIRQNASILVGIDPGTNTGIAVKMHGVLKLVETVIIFNALNHVRLICDEHGRDSVFVRVEDARLRTWFGKSGPERWKGAGSIGRDCAIWEEVLTDLKIPFEMVHPKFVKETTVDYFKKLTGWQGRTSKHAREAAWLIL